MARYISLALAVALLITSATVVFSQSNTGVFLT